MFTSINAVADVSGRKSRGTTLGRKIAAGTLASALAVVGLAGPASAIYVSPSGSSSHGRGWETIRKTFYGHGVRGYANYIEPYQQVRIKGERFGTDVHTVWFYETAEKRSSTHRVATSVTPEMEQR